MAILPLRFPLPPPMFSKGFPPQKGSHPKGFPPLSLHTREMIACFPSIVSKAIRPIAFSLTCARLTSDDFQVFSRRPRPGEAPLVPKPELLQLLQLEPGSFELRLVQQQARASASSGSCLGDGRVASQPTCQAFGPGMDSGSPSAQLVICHLHGDERVVTLGVLPRETLSQGKNWVHRFIVFTPFWDIEVSGHLGECQP